MTKQELYMYVPTHIHIIKRVLFFYSNYFYSDVVDSI